MQPLSRGVKRPMLNDSGCSFSFSMADVDPLYLRPCKILINLADAFFSSSWRILEPYGCPTALGWERSFGGPGRRRVELN